LSGQKLIASDFTRLDMQTVKVPQLAWYDTRELELPLPDDWQVETCYMAGYNRPELKAGEIRAAIRNPIGTKPLRQLARGKKEAVIVFDDQTRVTRVAKIVPHVLEELAEAGIPDKSIRFICGLGLHGAMCRPDFVKKLGEDVVARFRCFNHNPFGNCVYVGTTSTFKTRVCINEEYMKCDLRIVIGACVPHTSAGFGGGGKMIMPGIASYESINWNHREGGAVSSTPLSPGEKPTQGMGLIDENTLKKDIDECAEMVGIDFLINPIVNLWGESVSVYAGDWKQAYAAAVTEAKTHYRTPRVQDKDVVLANCYAKVNEALISLVTAFPMVSTKGGDIVLIANAPEGQITHYLAGPFGRMSFAEQYAPVRIPAHVHQIIVFTEYPHPGASWLEEHEKIVYLSRWADVLKALQEFHGAGTRVAVIPDGTNQFFAWYD
jgi:nickel-dependent lactate racemase